MSDEQVYQRITDTGALNVIEMYIKEEALSVYGEGDVSGHDERLVYAEKVLDGTASIKQFAVAMSTVPAIYAKLNAGSMPTRTEIRTAIDGIFSKMSGYDG